MRCFILGATGRTGNELVNQALTRGHHVTAFVRSPQNLVNHHERLTVITGDLRRVDQLVPAMVGQDAVFFAVGPSRLGPSTLRGDCARTAIEAMRANDVRRVLVLSSALLFANLGLIATFLRRFVLYDVLPDAGEMERVVKSSGMEWTIVRPVRLTTGAFTARYRVKDGGLPRGGGSICRAAVADFMLVEAENNAHLEKVVGLRA